MDRSNHMNIEHCNSTGQHKGELMLRDMAVLRPSETREDHLRCPCPRLLPLPLFNSIISGNEKLMSDRFRGFRLYSSDNNEHLTI